MSFPIFFKMEIKKGWRKSCDFVISNPVSGVSPREPIVRALHSQRGAQVQRACLCALSPRPVSPHAAIVSVSGRAPSGRTALHALYHHPLHRPVKVQVLTCRRAHNSARPGCAGQAKRRRQLWLFTCSWLGFAPQKTSNSENPGRTVSCKLEQLIQPEKHLNSPAGQYEARTASPQHCAEPVPKPNSKEPRENVPA